MKPQFYADLHIHSRYSRATSKNLTARNLAAWSCIKGINVLGTGDFTHPKWRQELRESLVFDEPTGLYRLASPEGLSRELPVFSDHDAPFLQPPLFMLQSEISSIYKKDGKVRKVHNLVFMPDLDHAERFSQRLAAIGNLESDGRPILGLDSRDLLEIALETSSKAFVIPAHIWTPWFSLFGSKSGFDAIEACFGDLAPEIFALETGLSSDPDMNRLWSALDRFTLVSNSDAHSGEKLGREVNVFSGTPSYEGIFRALRQEASSCHFEGTVEFFPEEGKYFYDGHRACGVVLSPQESIEKNGLCPVCGKPMTLGVLYRVQELADRAQPVYGEEKNFSSLIPLTEVLAELTGVGVQSKKVAERYARTVKNFGSELAVLQHVPTADLAHFDSLLGEAVTRMREGRVFRQEGYDGEFGVIRVFSPEERKDLRQGAFFFQGLLDSAPESRAGPDHQAADPSPDPSGVARKQPAVHSLPLLRMPSRLPEENVPKPSSTLNPRQERAVNAGPGPVLVIAGPGTGKTHTLIQRVRRLLLERHDSSEILVLTFTKRAADELQERLRLTLDSGCVPPAADTLHAIAYAHWHASGAPEPVLLNEDAAKKVFIAANSMETEQSISATWERLCLDRERLQTVPTDQALLLARYQKRKHALGLADYTDLLERFLTALQTTAGLSPWTNVLVDEAQDLSPLQLAVVRAMAGPSGNGLFAIGDPDQSIYGFRGAHGKIQDFFLQAWPHLEMITLSDSYRSAPAILRAAGTILAGHSKNQPPQCGTRSAWTNTAV